MMWHVLCVVPVCVCGCGCEHGQIDINALLASVILSRFRPTLCHACGMSCASRGGLARDVALAVTGAVQGRHVQRWMFRGPGRCGGCQAVLYKFQNWSNTRRCHSCGAALKFSRHAYCCESCALFACKQCTDASRVLRCDRNP